MEIQSNLIGSTNHTGDPIPDISIVLVGWNNKNYLEPCLLSLYQAEMQHDYDVIVVDNGSTDGSQAMLCEKFPQVKLVQNDRNLGLSRASNQGINETRGKYVLLLNNDTLVNGASLDAMAEFLDKNLDAGAVGGILLNPDGSFQGGYANFSTLREEFLIATRLGELIWKGYPSHGNMSQVLDGGWMSSACLMVRRSALDQVGLLDEEYFIYGDEADLQYRLKKAGWKVCFLPSSSTIHFGGRSMDRWRRRKMVYRGKMLFYKKNYSFLSAFLLRCLLAGLSVIKLIIWGITWLVPKWRVRAIREVKSNQEVIALCFNLK
jgi:N-acetylglucosaminyl-diphospho-decaprenol L-rhamnosyltransferase